MASDTPETMQDIAKQILDSIRANHAKVELAGGLALDVRRFDARDHMSRLFEVRVVAVSTNLDIDFDSVIGQEATFSLGRPWLGGLEQLRIWKGIAVGVDQTRVDPDGLATYEITIAPRAHLLSLRTNYRIFQYMSELDIVTQILGEWGIEHRVLADGAAHKQRKFRVQYGESDLAFVSRMLEDAGIAYWFDGADGQSTMVLDDRPASRAVEHPALRFFDRPNEAAVDFATKVAVVERARPGKRTIGDLDYRRAPTAQPILSAADGRPQEAQLEQYDYEPGAFLYVGGSGGGTPAADDRGTTRTDESQGNAVTKGRHFGARSDAKGVRIESNVIALGPGVLFGIVDHPHPSLAGASFLTVSSRIAGEHSSDWRAEVEAASTEIPYCPPRVTPKPCIHGLESATVVGPSADEIHTDEFARVRVHFHWDRAGSRDDSSSCWIPTNQPWAGAGFGGTVIPRIGQEVLVEFLNGDPDRPIVIGRVFTERQPPPYPLPAGKKITGLVGKTSPGLVLGGALDPWHNNNMKEKIGSPGESFLQKKEFASERPKEFPTSNHDNAFLLGDEQNNNLVFLQAKKDLFFLVKHGWRTVVGNYRGCLVDGDDHLFVRNKQLISVIADQGLRVVQDQTITVRHNREETVEENIAHYAHKDLTIATDGPLDLKSEDKAITVEAGQAIELKVGNSVITITKQSVTIDSTRVDVNP